MVGDKERKRDTMFINRYTSNPRFLLVYSPLQFAPNEMAKPDGSLGLLYLAGALRQAGFEVKILDISVGNEKDDLKDTFLIPNL